MIPEKKPNKKHITEVAIPSSRSGQRTIAKPFPKTHVRGRRCRFKAQVVQWDIGCARGAYVRVVGKGSGGGGGRLPNLSFGGGVNVMGK